MFLARAQHLDEHCLERFIARRKNRNPTVFDNCVRALDRFRLSNNSNVCFAPLARSTELAFPGWRGLFRQSLLRSAIRPHMQSVDSLSDRCWISYDPRKIDMTDARTLVEFAWRARQQKQMRRPKPGIYVCSK